MHRSISFLKMEKTGPRFSKPWSFRRVILFSWIAFCVYFILTSWYHTSTESHEMFILYFQSSLPVFAMLWFWTLNIYVFEILHIPYEQLFEDSKTLPRSSGVLQIATVFSTLLLTASTVFLAALASNFQQLANWTPMVFLLICLLIWLMPINAFYGQNRINFFKTCGRVLVPILPVRFTDFLLADVLTSLARSISDSVRGVCVLTLLSFSNLKNDDSGQIEFHCGRRTLYTNLALGLPYCIRMIQCLSIYYRDHDRVQLFNAVKYFTTFPVIFSSMMKHRASSEDWMQCWNRVWILASILNTGYSYFWDVEMDWDISWFRSWKQSSIVSWLPSLRSDALYSPQWVYAFALVSNFIIRVAWIYKLSLHLPYTQEIHLLVALLEVYRRCQWIFIRFENGLRKNNLLAQNNGSKHVKV